jgi:DNA repair protein RecO (recombination protein O)
MYFKTKAIVLNQIKYSDTSLIACLYTEVFGRRSFLVQGAYRRKSKHPAIFFQPLTLLEMEVSISPRRELQRIKDAAILHPFQTIPYQPDKGAIALFLSEIFYKTLREEEGNPAMFEFLENVIQFMDHMEQGVANFHLWLLLHFSKYLGFFPIDNYSNENCVFDSANGRFYNPVLNSVTNQEKDLAQWIHQLLSLSPEKLSTLELNHSLRNDIISLFIEYYQIHLGHLGPIKSLPVLQGVFGE